MDRGPQTALLGSQAKDSAQNSGLLRAGETLSPDAEAHDDLPQQSWGH